MYFSYSFLLDLSLFYIFLHPEEYFCRPGSWYVHYLHDSCVLQSRLWASLPLNGCSSDCNAPKDQQMETCPRLRAAGGRVEKGSMQSGPGDLICYHWTPAIVIYEPANYIQFISECFYMSVGANYKHEWDCVKRLDAHKVQISMWLGC